MGEVGERALSLGMGVGHGRQATDRDLCHLCRQHLRTPECHGGSAPSIFSGVAGWVRKERQSLPSDVSGALAGANVELYRACDDGVGEWVSG